MARPGSGKGKGREERKPEGLEAHMVGGGALIFPDPPWLELPAPALAKSFFLGLIQGFVQGAAGEWGLGGQ